MKKFFLIFIFLSFFAFSNDKIVSFVGNKPILKSDVERRMAQENTNYNRALRKLIEEKLLLCGAEEEGIEVKKEEIEKETEKIKSKYPDETTFLRQLEKENISLSDFKKMVVEKIKVRKFIRDRIIKKLNIMPSEIAKEIENLKKSSYMFNFKFKWFNTKEKAEEFLKKGENKKMNEAGWMESNEILPEILEILKKTKKGSFSQPGKIGDRYIVIFLIDFKKSETENKIELYKKAKNYVYMMKFEKFYRELIKNLESKIPVKILKTNFWTKEGNTR